jgi:hypothetical protein
MKRKVIWIMYSPVLGTSWFTGWEPLSQCTVACPEQLQLLHTEALVFVPSICPSVRDA